MTENNRKVVSLDQLPPVMREKAIWWMKAFACHGHFIEPMPALKLAGWWEDAGAPLLLEGEAGGGKTSISYVLTKIMNAAFYKLQCFKNIGPQQALYGWDTTLQRIYLEQANRSGRMPEKVNEIIYDNNKTMLKGAFVQALEDDRENVIFLIDEVDKLPVNEYAEAMFLEILGEHRITVDVNQTVIKRRDGLNQVRFILTSNLGKSGFVEIIGTAKRESLSFPLLRRSRHYIHVPPPGPAGQYCILRLAAPKLPMELIIDCVQFLQRIRERAALDKPVSLYEAKAWVLMLQNFSVTELTREVLEVTVSTLAKMPLDEDRLIAATDAALDFSRRHRREFIEKLQKDVLMQQVLDEFHRGQGSDQQ